MFKIERKIYMNKNFNVKGFVEDYEKKLTNTEKESYLKGKLKTEKYLPYADKLATAENIVKSSSYAMIKEDGVLKKTDKIEINSPLRYILFVMSIIDKYTNIEVNFKNIMPEFDYLNKNNLFEAIFAKIGDREINEFNTVVEMVLDDFVSNKFETKNYISDIFLKLASLAEKSYPLIDNIINKLDTMSEEDKNKLSGLLGKFGKFVK